MIRFISALLVTLAAASSASAAVLTFDDVVSTGQYDNVIAQQYHIADGYGGLNWDNVWVVDTTMQYQGTGYDNGTVSGNYVGFNGYAWTASSAGSTFDFNGLYLTSAWYENNTVTLNGYTNGALSYTSQIVVGTSNPTWLQADFFGIDQLTISTNNQQVAFDNFTFNAGTNVPELDPSQGTAAFTLLLGGVAVVFGGRRRRA